jgi:hypothetical protein
LSDEKLQELGKIMNGQHRQRLFLKFPVSADKEIYFMMKRCIVLQRIFNIVYLRSQGKILQLPDLHQ